MERFRILFVPIVRLAGLLHDLGKSIDRFQGMLIGPPGSYSGPYRHEWISLRLLQSFVGSDDDRGWLARLAEISPENECWFEHLYRDGIDGEGARPFEDLPPIAAVLSWIVLTHHRLPLPPPGNNGNRQGVVIQEIRAMPENFSSRWNRPWAAPNGSSDGKVTACDWTFSRGLPTLSAPWRQSLREAACELLSLHGDLSSECEAWRRRPFGLHLARAALILGDHYYSARCEGDPEWIDSEDELALWANTDRATGRVNQALEAHLRGVGHHGAIVANHLSTFNATLPRLVGDDALHEDAPSGGYYAWQNHAYAATERAAESASTQGFFGLNMASTGRGKTLANGRIIAALSSEGEGCRFTVALGLRTLTLQTGDALRERLSAGEHQVAVRVGGEAVTTLHQLRHEEESPVGGAIHSDDLSDEGATLFRGETGTSPLLDYLPNDDARRFVSAPVLVCTIDHLIPATETLRGGRHIPALLRVMTGDVVIDEVDEFDIDDFPALTRLVNWVGMLGRRVVLSSATLPPGLAKGLFEAYRAGREEFERFTYGQTGSSRILCGWYAESESRVSSCDSLEGFRDAHRGYVSRRRDYLADRRIQAPRCKGRLVPLGAVGVGADSLHDSLAAQVVAEACCLHEDHHLEDEATGSRVSFGVVRLANIQPLVQVAQALYRAGAPADYQIHLCTYHSRYPLLMRSRIEEGLERVLARHPGRGGAAAPLQHPEVRERLDAEGCSHAGNHLFVVLASPVIETGRDLDFDWGIAEPSSMRALIQLAGRLYRHRADCHVSAANLSILSHNLRALALPGEPAFQRPGFETCSARLVTHDIAELLAPWEWETIDAIPRIVEPEELRPERSLSDLEHYRIRRNLLPPPSSGKCSRGRRRRRAAPPPVGAYSWYTEPQAQLSGALQIEQPFRGQSAHEVELFLLPGEGGGLELWQLHNDRGRERVSEQSSRWRQFALSDTASLGIFPWMVTPYREALCSLGESLGMGVDEVAKQFGRVRSRELREGEQWGFSEALGLHIAALR